MGVQEKLEAIKAIKPYYLTFNFYYKELTVDLERALGAEEISLAQYKQLKNELQDLGIKKLNLVHVRMVPVFKQNFKIMCNVRKLLTVRSELDSYYGYLKNAKSVDNNFINNLIDKLLDAIRNKDFEKAYDLFYFFTCWVRCRPLAQCNSFNVKIVGSIYQVIIKHCLDELQVQEVKSLQVFGSLKDFKLNANAVAAIVGQSLLSKNEQETFDYAVKIIKAYYKIGSTESLQIIEDLAKIILNFFQVEEDYSELFCMVKCIKDYSEFSVVDVLSEEIVNLLIIYIDNYFKDFDDIDCYSFVVNSSLYFSNAATADSVIQVKNEIRNLLLEYDVKDYDKILDRGD